MNSSSSSMQAAENAAEASVGRRTRAQTRRLSLSQCEGTPDSKPKTPVSGRVTRSTPKSTTERLSLGNTRTPAPTPQKKSRKSTLPDIAENASSSACTREKGNIEESLVCSQKTGTETPKPQRRASRRQSKAKEEKVVENEVDFATSQDSFSSSSSKRRSEPAPPLEIQGTVENCETPLASAEKGGKTNKRKSTGPFQSQKQGGATPKKAKGIESVETPGETVALATPQGKQRRKSTAADAKAADKVCDSVPSLNTARKDEETSDTTQKERESDEPVGSAEKENNKQGELPGGRQKQELQQNTGESTQRNSNSPKKKIKENVEEENVEMKDYFVKEQEDDGNDVHMKDSVEAGSQDVQNAVEAIAEPLKDNENEATIPDKLVGSAKRKTKQNKQLIIRESSFTEDIFAGEEYERSPKKKKSLKGNLITREEEDKEEMECQEAAALQDEQEGGAADLDPEAFNRTLSEEISLLKPRAFLSGSFLRQAMEADGSGAEADSDAECRKAIMESAQRRIEQSLSTSESDSRLLQRSRPPAPAPGSATRSQDSESESAPEAVSFNTGRQSILDAMRSVSEHVQRERQKAKERRRARLEALKQQKEEKLIRLKEKRASQEDASCSSSEESGYEEEARNARLKKKKKARSQVVQPGKENLAADTAGPAAGAHTYSGGESADTSDKEKAAKAKESSVASRLLKLSMMSIDKQEKPKEWKKPTSQKGKPPLKIDVEARGSKIYYDGDRVVNDEEKKRAEEEKAKTMKKSKLETLDPVQSRLAQLAMSKVVPVKKGQKPTLGGMDFIPIHLKGAKTSFKVVPLDRNVHKPTTLAQRPEDFRTTALFGLHRREPAKASLAYQQKLKAAGKDRHVR